MTNELLIIIVLYYPNEEHLIALIRHCLNYKNCTIFLSDNAQIHPVLKDALKNLDQKRIIYECNNQNLGVAGGQNKGLKFALAHNYLYTLLFDQDSNINECFINQLIKEFKKIKRKHPEIIAVGPSFTDFRLPGERGRRYVIPENLYRKMVIASGCIIFMPELKKVGLMDELLFIDHVDTEWCYRARSRNYKIMQLSNVVMNHSIGEMKKTWWGYYLQYHATIRYYYFFRNSILLFSRKYIPLKDRLYLVLRNLIPVLKLPFLNDKFLRLKLIMKGIKEGVRLAFFENKS